MITPHSNSPLLGRKARIPKSRDKGFRGRESLGNHTKRPSNCQKSWRKALIAALEERLSALRSVTPEA